MTRTRSLWAALLALAFAMAAAFTLSTAPSAYAADDDASAATTWNRLEGDVALDTMSAIVNEGWEDSGTVILTTQDGYWDALTAAGIAGQVNAPILMTDTNSLSPQTEKLLGKLDPALIIIVGGTAAVSEDVEAAAGRATSGETLVLRAAGDNAIGTANAVAAKMKEYTEGTWADTAFIATNDGYWDALAAAPVAYYAKAPIFLADGHASLTDDTIKAMNDAGIKNVYLVGGTAALTEDVEKQLTDNAFTIVDRLGGETAIETSEAVANEGISAFGMQADGMGVATMDGYWDALTGAALCGKNGSVLVLANKTGESDSIDTFITDNKAEISKAYIFGGTAAISADVAAAIDKVAPGNEKVTITFVVQDSDAEAYKIEAPEPQQIAKGVMIRDSQSFTLPEITANDGKLTGDWYTDKAIWDIPETASGKNDPQMSNTELASVGPKTTFDEDTTLYLKLLTTFTVTVKDADGNTVKSVPYDAASLQALASDSTTPVSGIWGSRMATSTLYVTLKDLVDDAMGAGYWASLPEDATLAYAASDNKDQSRSVGALRSSVYGKSFKDAATSMPAVLALTVQTGNLADYGDDADATQEALAKDQGTATTPRMVYGPESATADNTSSGMAFLSYIRSITITLPASTSAQSLQAATL